MRREFTLTFDGVNYKIVVDGNAVLVNGQPFAVGLDDQAGRVLVDGTAYDVAVDLGAGRAVVGGISYPIGVEGLEAEPERPGRAGARPAATEGTVSAIMPGKIIRVPVALGAAVAEGDVVCILEAMKMQNELKAPRAGTITAIHVQPGQDVERGAPLVAVE